MNFLVPSFLLCESKWNQNICSIKQTLNISSSLPLQYNFHLEYLPQTLCLYKSYPFLRPASDSTSSKISILVAKVFSLDRCYICLLLLGCMDFVVFYLFGLALHFQLYCNSWMSDTICHLSLDSNFITYVMVLSCYINTLMFVRCPHSA